MLDAWVAGRKTASQRGPHPNPWNLRMCQVTWHVGIKVINQLTLRWGDYHGLPGGPNVITRILKRGREVEEVRAMWEPNPLLALKLEKEAKSQERGLPFQTGEGKEIDSLLKPPKRQADTLILARWDCAVHLTHGTTINLCCSGPIWNKLRVIYYENARKPTHLSQNLEYLTVKTSWILRCPHPKETAQLWMVFLECLGLAWVTLIPGLRWLSSPALSLLVSFFNHMD